MTPSDISLRRAGADDGRNLSLLFVELDEHHVRMRPDLFKQLDGPARSDEMLRELIADVEAQAIFVAEAALGDLLGFVHVRERCSPETVVAPASTYAEIDALAVKTDFRRGGVAKALVGQAERWAKERGLNQLVLSVRAFNHSAVAAYEALGFEHIVHRMARSISD